MEDSVDIKEEVFYEDSTNEIKEEWEESTKVKCEDSKEGILDVEFAVDIKKIQEKEEIYVWNSFESAQEGPSTLTKGNAASMEIVSQRKGSNPHTKKSHQCLVCDAKFAQRGGLKSHMRIHTGEKPYECEVCSAKFTHASSLSTHVRLHTGEKPYQCEFCSAKFAQLSSLKSHKNIHTGEKPYQCEVCSAKFARANGLRAHIKIHTGEKPYECEVCSAKFTEASKLRNHTRIHTGEKPFQCQICDVKFTHKSNLRAHKRVHSGETPYECDLCNTKFHRANILNNHILKIHFPEKNSYLCGHCKLKFWLSDDFKSRMKILGELTTRFPAGETPDECHLCKTKLTNAKPNN